MSQENFSESDDLTQIVANQRSSLQLLEELATQKPEIADELTEMHERVQKNLDGLEDIAKREQEKNL